MDTALARRHMDENNPIITHRFAADPCALVYGGRVYLYMSGDQLCRGADGEYCDNAYESITGISVISSSDMVNWTDHGEIKAAGADGIASWAVSAISPCCVVRNTPRGERFYLYFSNTGRGIGVLEGASPLGPFTDPLKTHLVSHDTENCADVPWVFDPSVLVDDDGQAYLYFGGGIPDEERFARPKTARVVRLSPDMISLCGIPQDIDTPYHFEGSGINKIGRTYYYSYCSNWRVVRDGMRDSLGFGDAYIVYMTASNPMGPFRFGGVLLKNPGEYFGRYGKNHHSMFNFCGKWYIAYHTEVMPRELYPSLSGYRSPSIDELKLSSDGTIECCAATVSGVSRLAPLDPYSETSGATIYDGGGISVVGKVGETSVISTRAGGWSMVKGADFGKGADKLIVTAAYSGKAPARLLVFADGFDDLPCAEILIKPSEEPAEYEAELSCEQSGIKNLRFAFGAKGIRLCSWRFVKPEKPVKKKKLTEVTGEPLLIGGDFPDPDVIRLGDSYYMATTTMHFMPGCAILRSHDLLHWEICTHVYAHLDNTPAQCLEGAQNIYGKGMWAASLRYRAGTFYVTFIANDTGKTYIFRSESIMGPWCGGNIEGFYYDNSLFFDDDGRAFIVHGNTTIRITELNEELTAPKENGFDTVIIREKGNSILGYEGSHMYKVDGRYYLFMIHSLASRWRRVQACFSSDSLEGRFTGCDVLVDDMGYFDQGVAQGGIVKAEDGKWYAVLFQDRGAVGRIPVLMPMRFEAGKPTLGICGKVPKQVSVMTSQPDYVYAPIWQSDDFAYKTDKNGHCALKNVWEFNHTPDDALWRVESDPPRFVIRTGKLSTNVTQARNTLTQRTAYPYCEAEVAVDGSLLSDGDFAGLCALQGRFGQIAIKKQEGEYSVSLVLRDDADMTPCGAETASVKIRKSCVRLKARFDFADLADTVTFYYKECDSWKQLGKPHQLRFMLDHFTGCRIGLFAYSTKESGGEAAFSDFIIETKKCKEV